MTHLFAAWRVLALVGAMVGALMLAPGPAVAQEQPADQPPDQPQALSEEQPLSDEQAERAVRALEALEARGLLLDAPDQQGNESAEAAAIIREHGFTPQEWMDTLQALADGYVALKAGRWHEMPGATEDYQAMRQAIRDNPDLDPDTRQQALAELERRMGPQVAASPGAEAVAPFEDRLDVLFDGED